MKINNLPPTGCNVHNSRSRWFYRNASLLLHHHHWAPQGDPNAAQLAGAHRKTVFLPFIFVFLLNTSAATPTSGCGLQKKLYFNVAFLHKFQNNMITCLQVDNAN